LRTLIVRKIFRAGRIFLFNSLVLASIQAFPCSGFADPVIDGRLDEPEWAEAQVFQDFVVVEPLTYGTPRMRTEARLMSLPEGLAIAIICEQPEDIRTRTITQRDPERFDSDVVNLMIDFDGKGEKIYQFSVSISGAYRDGTLDYKNNLNKDWDGVWQRAVYEDKERWTVEMLLPWSIVAMRGGNGETRRLGVFFQRDIYASGESFAFPKTSTKVSRFMADLEKVDVKLFSKAEFNVWPYAVVMRDLVNDKTKTKAGLDLFWKPTGGFQVAATINPDFGQVESDDLVINFSAIEVMFSDKRPFFTENQAIFDDPLVKNEGVFYTRRVGGARDDNSEVSDIDGAVKVIGSAGPLNYGLFAAREADADEVGRTFYDGRFVLPGEKWLLGTQTTWTERPFLDRTALVNSLNYDIKPGKSLRLLGQFMRSDIDISSDEQDGYGSFNAIQFVPNNRWESEFSLIYYTDTFDINDMGYLRRNDLEEWYLSIKYNQTDFPEDSRTASVTWTAFGQLPYNTEGLKLMENITMMRSQKMRSGSEFSLRLNAALEGYDDMFSRGNGPVYLKNRFNGGLTYSAPRRGAWRKSVGIEFIQEGFEGWGAGLQGSLTWYPYEKLNIDFTLQPRWSSDWLIWLNGDKFGGYSRTNISSKLTANWFPAERHEVRLNAQWLTIDARAEQGYSIGPGGSLVENDEMVSDFAKINFGLQVRYRFEIAPLSEFYIVYSRGGLESIDNPDQSTIELLGDSTGLRDADQILVKLRYGF
jgi:hypothetical protein